MAADPFEHVRVGCLGHDGRVAPAVHGRQRVAGHAVDVRGALHLLGHRPSRVVAVYHRQSETGRHDERGRRVVGTELRDHYAADRLAQMLCQDPYRFLHALRVRERRGADAQGLQQLVAASAGRRYGTHAVDHGGDGLVVDEGLVGPSDVQAAGEGGLEYGCALGWVAAAAGGHEQASVYEVAAVLDSSRGFGSWERSPVTSARLEPDGVSWICCRLSRRRADRRTAPGWRRPGSVRIR